MIPVFAKEMSYFDIEFMSIARMLAMLESSAITGPDGQIPFSCENWEYSSGYELLRIMNA